MKLILSLLDTPAFGGAEQYLLSQLYELQKLPKTKVILATNRQSVKDRVEEDGNRIKIIHLPYRLDAIGNWKGLVKYFVHAPLALMWFLLTLKRISAKYKTITVYTPGFSDRMLFSPFIKLLGHHLIWLEFGPLRPLFKRNWGFPKLLYALGMPFPDKVVTISEYTKRCMLRDTSIPEEKITIVYPTTPVVTNSELKKLKKQGAAWQSKQNLKDKKIICFVGRLASEKEVDLLIKSFAVVHQKNANTFLLVIGEGPERQKYEKLVEKLKLQNFVLFTGFVSELEKKFLIAISDVFVFPSAWELEGFGMTTIEAMMLGVPVISSGAGPQGEVVTHEKNGLVFKPHTPKALTNQIMKILGNDTLAATLSTAARKSLLTPHNRRHLAQTINNMGS